MELGSFDDFCASFDVEEAEQDIRSSCGDSILDDRIGSFTQEQYDVISRTAAIQARAVIQQYHKWLQAQLED